MIRLLQIKNAKAEYTRALALCRVVYQAAVEFGATEIGLAVDRGLVNVAVGVNGFGFASRWARVSESRVRQGINGWRFNLRFDCLFFLQLLMPRV